MNSLAIPAMRRLFAFAAAACAFPALAQTPAVEPPSGVPDFSGEARIALLVVQCVRAPCPPFYVVETPDRQRVWRPRRITLRKAGAQPGEPLKPPVKGVPFRVTGDFWFRDGAAYVLATKIALEPARR